MVDLLGGHVHRAAGDLHPVGQGIADGVGAREGRQQRGVGVEHPPAVHLEQAGAEHGHEAGHGHGLHALAPPGARRPGRCRPGGRSRRRSGRGRRVGRRVPRRRPRPVPGRAGRRPPARQAARPRTIASRIDPLPDASTASRRPPGPPRPAASVPATRRTGSPARTTRTTRTTTRRPTVAEGAAAEGGPMAAGWHRDPAGRFDHRYYDGRRWTDAVATGGVSSTDPLGVPDSARTGRSGGRGGVHAGRRGRDPGLRQRSRPRQGAAGAHAPRPRWRRPPECWARSASC